MKNTNDRLYTVREVAHHLRVDTTTVRRWIAQGTLEAVVLPHVRERQAYRIKYDTLNTILGTSAVKIPDLDPTQEEVQAL